MPTHTRAGAHRRRGLFAPKLSFVMVVANWILLVVNLAACAAALSSVRRSTHAPMHADPLPPDWLPGGAPRRIHAPSPRHLHGTYMAPSCPCTPTS